MEKTEKSTIKYKIDLRSVDDKIIETIIELDKLIDKAVRIIVTAHPNYVIDHLLNQTYSKDIRPGGVRIFLGSRKKENIKLKLINLISFINTPEKFIEIMNKQGLVRGVKEKIVIFFVESFQKNPISFLKHYNDPYPTYRNVLVLYLAYEHLKKHTIRITFITLSRIVLSRYKGWTFRRTINSDVDYSDYEEDVQNSLFSISKAVDLFNTKKNKSFFSYATRWIKEGISSNTFTITTDDIITQDEYGNNINIKFEPISSIKLESVSGSYTDYDEDESTIKAIEYLKGSFPLPNELRILYRLLSQKNVTKRR